MSKLKWDQIGERIYETGLDHGVLYPVTKSGTYDKGVAWNGLSAVNESPSGAEANPVWADNIKYLNLRTSAPRWRPTPILPSLRNVTAPLKSPLA